MTWEMHDRECETVMSLPSDQRYTYFIKRVSDWQEVWSLWNKGGWILAGDAVHEHVPVWPHPRFAEACADGEWAETEPRAIALQDWLEKWTPGMIRDQRQVAIFPTPAMKGIIVTPERLHDDLNEALVQYE